MKLNICCTWKSAAFVCLSQHDLLHFLRFTVFQLNTEWYSSKRILIQMLYTKWLTAL